MVDRKNMGLIAVHRNGGRALEKKRSLRNKAGPQMVSGRAGQGGVGPTFNALVAKNGDLHGAPDKGWGPGKTSEAPQIPAGPHCGAPGGACQVIPCSVSCPGPRALQDGAGLKFHALVLCAVRG